MEKRLSRVWLLLLLVPALDRPAWPQESQPPRPPDAPSIISAGRTIGGKSRDAYLATGGFLKKCGVAIGRGSARLFVKQGEFWKRFGKSFADFQEQPAVQPRAIDQQ